MCITCDIGALRRRGPQGLLGGRKSGMWLKSTRGSWNGCCSELAFRLAPTAFTKSMAAVWTMILSESMAIESITTSSIWPNTTVYCVKPKFLWKRFEAGAEYHWRIPTSWLPLMFQKWILSFFTRLLPKIQSQRSRWSAYAWGVNTRPTQNATRYVHMTLYGKYIHDAKTFAICSINTPIKKITQHQYTVGCSRFSHELLEVAAHI